MVAKQRRERVNMGIGKLGNSSLIFVRQFRFNLKGEHLDENCVKGCSFDLVTKTITIDGYEWFEKNGDVPIETWANGMQTGQWPTETLTLVTYDGCGEPIYEYVFETLTLQNRQLKFDYSTSDESTQKIVLSFKKHSYEFLQSVSDKKYSWKFKLDDNSKEIDVEIDERPKVEIEETSVGRLNGTTWIPGRAKWQKLSLTLANEDMKALQGLMATLASKNNLAAGELRLYDEDKKLVETWDIQHMWVGMKEHCEG